MKVDERTAYTTAAQLYNKELDRLFQRVNFFLIGSSFLIVAFVTLLRSALCFGSFHYVLFYLVNMAGFLLSVFFTITNFRMALFLAKMLDYLGDLENPETAKQMFPYHRTKRFENGLKKLGFCSLMSELVTALAQLVRIWCRPCRKPIDKLCKRASEADELVAEHTWLVPFGFIHFWWVSALLSVIFR